MWENTAQPNWRQLTNRSMRTACWIPMDTSALSQHVSLIAFPLQQRLHERDSNLRYKYRVIKKDGLNFVSPYFKIKTSDTDSLFVQICDSNDECSSSLEVEC